MISELSAVIGAGQGHHTVEVRSDHSDSCHRRLPTGHVLRHPLARMTAPELNKITKHGALLFLPSCLPNYKYTYLSCMNYFFQTSTGGCALPNQVKSIETDGYTPNGALWAPSQPFHTHLVCIYMIQRDSESWPIFFFSLQFFFFEKNNVTFETSYCTGNGPNIKAVM